MAVITPVAYQYSRSVRVSLQLRFENRGLVENVLAAQKKVEATVRELEREVYGTVERRKTVRVALRDFGAACLRQKPFCHQYEPRISYATERNHRICRTPLGRDAGGRVGDEIPRLGLSPRGRIELAQPN